MDEIAVEPGRSGTGTVTRLDALIIGAGVAGLYQLHQLREPGPEGPRLRQRLGRRRHLVLEPLPGRPLRLRVLHLPVPVLGGPLQGLELERALPGPARDRAVAELRRRQARPAPRHPVRHHDHPCALERGDRTLDGRDRRWRDHRHPVPRHLLRDALGPADRGLSRPGQLQGPDLPHGPLAQGAGGPGRQARGRGRHRCHRHPGDPDHRRPGRAAEGVRPHAAVRAADEEPDLRPGGAGGLQGPLRGAEGHDPPHLHRLRVRLRARAGPS